VKVSEFQSTYRVKTDHPNEAGSGGTSYFVVGVNDVTDIDVEPGLVTVTTKSATYVLTAFGAGRVVREVPKPAAPVQQAKGRSK